MAFRDPQPIALSRQAVLLVMAVGVGLIALSYILGVQVGKGSAALRQADARSVEDQLRDLPEPLLDQLKLFQTTEPSPPSAPARPEETQAGAAPATRPEPGPEARSTPKAEAAAKEDPKPVAKSGPKAAAKDEPRTALKAEPRPEPKAAPATGTERWTLQLVATEDRTEATRVAARVRAAGFPANVVRDGATWKVRLARTAPRDAADATADKLRQAGFKPFAVRAD
jgi:cell division protein FtsN